MSLYTTAQSEASFILATNLDSSTTERAVRTGSNASSEAFGTITQNASSLTGNASYDFSSNGRVLHQWDNVPSSTSSFLLEAVFKKSSSGSLVTLLQVGGSSSGAATIDINTDGTIRGFFRNAFSQTISATSSVNVCDGQWHHVVLAYSKQIQQTTVFRLYLDGALAAESTSGISDTSWGYGRALNIGSTLNAAGTTASQFFNGTIDFAAFYTGVTTAAAADTLVASHVATFANKTVAADAATASSLAVDPAVTVTRNISVAADPATASATFPEAQQSDIDLPILLETYMQSLATAGHLEQWWKFDQYKVVTNYGTGGNSGIGFLGNSYSENQNGIQGSGTIRFTGSLNDGAIIAQNPLGCPAYNPELSDGNYVMGMWFKVPAGMTDTRTIFAASDSSGRYINLNFLGGISKFNYIVNTSNGTHTIQSTSTINPENWNFIAAKFSGTTMELFVNGVSQGTQTANGTLPGTINNGGFGTNNVAAIGGTPLYLSQFFIGNTTNITTTVLTNIYNAGADQLQASAEMPMPAFKDDNSFNTYVLGLEPYFYYKLDETSGAPQSITQPMNLLVEGSNFTQNITTKNKKGLRLTNRDTVFGNLWTAPAGTFSTNNRQSFAVYAKPVPGANANLIASTGAGNFAGSGIGLSFIINASGNVLLRIFTGTSADSITYTSTNVADSNYHLFVAVKDGSSLKLYIDGKLTNTASSTATLTDNGQFLLGGNGITALSNVSRDVTIDEVAMFASALTDAQVFEMYRSLTETMDTTATALFPMPGIIAGTGVTTTADPMTASGLLTIVVPFIAPAFANALFQMPNFLAQKVVSVTADVMTASAQGENPGFDIGENNLVLHMDAAAMMGDARALIPGKWNASPAIANPALMVQPAIVTTLGALIKPQSFNARAFAPLPPQYFTILDDLWYQRLVAIDEKDDLDGRSLVFFNTSDNFYVPSDPIPGSGWTAPLAVGKTAVNAVTTPLPAINGGFFDAQNRKAVNLRNIALTTGGVGSNGTGDADFTFEAMIRTTKSNQVLFAGTNTNIYNTQRTGIILRDGKLALTFSKDRRTGSVSANDQFLAFIGNKNIADGEWHHLIIQNRQTGVDGNGSRIQFWVDGQLDIQRYGNEMYIINTVGYNSIEPNSYSDFTISAFGLNLSAMVEENEINLNYLAAINVVPVKAPVATATATATPNNKGRGNRARALMLYFWPTQNYSTGIYKSRPERSTGLSGETSQNYHNYDQGGYGNDPDTFYQLTTYLNQGANKFYDWDIWPCPVVKLFDGDQWVGESHPILKDGITKSGTDKGTVYVDPITDNERYLNLMTDLKDLSQFDMICFRNYPDQSGEQDEYGVNAKGVVDEYFNLLDKNLFADFLKSLRDAVDTGISLFITNPQLAVDMGFIDTYHTVPDLYAAGNEDLSDPYVPIKINDPLETGTPQLSIIYPTDEASGDGYLDAYRNNYHEVVNTLEDLTDDAAFIWTDEIKYDVNGSEFGELDRWWSHVEYNDGLQPGDKFLISTTFAQGQSYFATPIEAVRAGKVITKFADTHRFGAVERVNPYRNYATSIAVEPGTVVAGKQIGAKVFISFTDVAGIQQGYGSQTAAGTSVEDKGVALKTDYWINYAFNNALITVEEKNELLADSIDRLPPSAERDALAYWTLNGQDIIGTLSAYGEETGSANDQTIDSAELARTGRKVSRSRRNKSKRSVGATGLIPNFMVLWGWATKNISVSVPSINTRGLWWLSDRLEYAGGLPQRPEAFNADAFMKQPVITGFKTATVRAQSALAVGAMTDTNFRTPGVTIAVLPLTATAFFVEKGTLVPAEPATAVARTPQDIRTITAESDQVVLYLIHVDPIVYLREDVIK
jgi:hypothetical protein